MTRRMPNGEEALAFLRKEGKHEGALTPEIVFLDLDMPKIDGWQLLAEMSIDGTSQAIPVVVLSSASRAQNEERALAMGAWHYLSKSYSLQRLTAALEYICRRLQRSSSASAGEK